MGVGKTTFGKKLANKLAYNFIDIDQLIEQETGLSITEIFKTKGEDFFRNLEKEAISNLGKGESTVVSTGGGLPCYNGLMDSLMEKGKVVHLDIPVKVMVNRLMNAKSKRPLIQGKSEEQLEAFINHTLSERNKYYERAHFTFDTRDVSATKIEAFAAQLSQ